MNFCSRNAACLIPFTLGLVVPALADPTLIARTDDDVARQFADYKYTGAAPLPLRVAREDWPGARQRIESDPDLGKWIAGRRARMAGWIAKYGDNSDWVAGWGHDMVDPATGVPLNWSWNMAEPPTDTAAQKRLHGAWVYYRRNANIENVREAARLFRLTDDPHLLDWVAAQLDLYASNYARWPLQHFSGQSQMMGQSLDEAVAAIALADASRLIARQVTPDRRARWDVGLFLPMLRNIQASNRGVNNISVWQASASAILALTLGQDADYRAAIDGAGGINDMVTRGVTPDYLWFEPSVAYAAYTQRALAEVFIAASLAGREASLRRSMLMTQDMIIGQATMQFADGTLPATGDSPPGMRASDPAVMALTQRTMPIKGTGRTLSWEALIDPLALSPSPALAETGSRQWDYSQSAMLRDAGWELYLQYGQRTRSHAQFDALSYQLRYQGTVITAPPGTAAYGSPLFLDYLRRSVAHNMPMINGDGQTRIGLGQAGPSSANSFTATQAGFSDGAVVTRTVAVSATAMAETTKITLPTGPVQRLGETFNTPCTVTSGAMMNASTAPVGTGFSYWHDTRAATAKDWAATLSCEGKRFGFLLSADKPGRVFVSKAPDRTGQFTNTTVYFESLGTGLEMKIRIMPL